MSPFPRTRGESSVLNPHASAVPRRVLIWVAGSGVGAAVVAMPDKGPRLFSFSETHGPSAVDLAGMAALVAAWLPVAVLLWSARSRLTGRYAWAAAILAVLGLVGLVVTIGLDLGPWWIAAAGVLVLAQFVALWGIARRPAPPR
jgi:hypothetical protein